ncbi:RNA methyltransferase [Xylaria nigripes]|nr:RNA methyltransferase [Xylaria nigripes]
MRFPNSSSLLCRRLLLTKVWNAPRVSIIPLKHASSLSGIHEGLRQSQGTQSNFKIKKGKKNIKDKGAKPQSRRARFHDPENDFGKKSLVYQMQHGAFKESMTKMQRADMSSSSRRSPNAPLTPESFMKDFNSNAEGPRQKTGRGQTSSRKRVEPKTSSRRSVNEPLTPESFMKDFYTSGEEPTRPSSKVQSRKNTDSKSPPRRPSGDRFESDDFIKAFNAGSEKSTKASVQTHAKKHTDEKLFSSLKYTDRAARVDGINDFKASTREESKSSTATYHRKQTNDVSFSGRPSPNPFAQDGFLDNVHASTGEATKSTAPAIDTNEESPSDRDESWGESKGRENRYNREKESWGAEDSPIRIPHTTAASQFLYGRSVVEAALKYSRRKLYTLYIYSGDGRQKESEDGALERLAQLKNVKIRKISNKDLRMMDKMAEGRPHNGCVLEASPLPQLPVKALGELSTDTPRFRVELDHQSKEDEKINGAPDFIKYQSFKNRKPLVLLLDGILDPGNLGGILRTAAFLGINEVAITNHSSAPLTAVSLKASSGASEALTLLSVNSPVDFLTKSRHNGWVVYAAVPSASKGNSHMTVDRIESYDPLASQPTILVIGSEGKGISKQVRRSADHEVSIPSLALHPEIDSLNVSVATGIICAAFVKKTSASMLGIEQASPKSELW